MVPSSTRIIGRAGPATRRATIWAADCAVSMSASPPALVTASVSHGISTRHNRNVIVNVAHGASGTAASMRPYVDGLAARGIDARAIALPVGKAERAVAVYRDQVPGLA